MHMQDGGEKRGIELQRDPKVGYANSTTLPKELVRE
jgi:hypothetical protein